MTERLTADYEAAPGERDHEMYMMMRALQDEVGIRLEPRKLKVNMVVIAQSVVLDAPRRCESLQNNCGRFPAEAV